MNLDSENRSRQLSQRIKEEITRTKTQQISFERFMEMVLFAPSLGYYQANTNLLGKSGDFVTAPEISARFSECLAAYCEPMLKAVASNMATNMATIIEVGPGTGRMAADLLLALEKRHCLPARYVLVEVSATLRAQQKANLAQWVPHLLNRIEYQSVLPSTPIEGLIIANEVIDALPVRRFEWWKGGLYEQYVYATDQGFAIRRGVPESQYVTDRLREIQRAYLQGVPYYVSEIRLSLAKWFENLQRVLSKGYIIIIDYGAVERKYYHPERMQGTLRCYYQQKAYRDPLQRIGLQDITADVDFTQVAYLASHFNLEVTAFVSQAAFLLATGLLEPHRMCYDNFDYLTFKGQVHQLISPAEMGDLCKIMVLGRQLSCHLLSLEAYDQRLSLSP